MFSQPNLCEKVEKWQGNKFVSVWIYDDKINQNRFPFSLKFGRSRPFPLTSGYTDRFVMISRCFHNQISWETVENWPRKNNLFEGNRLLLMMVMVNQTITQKSQATKQSGTYPHRDTTIGDLSTHSTKKEWSPCGIYSLGNQSLESRARERQCHCWCVVFGGWRLEVRAATDRPCDDGQTLF